MASVYDQDNFAGRVNYAATVICRNGDTTRHFDTCFEMWDGDAVAAALVRRAEKNPKLAKNLFRYVNESSAREAAARYAGRNLSDVAQELRRRPLSHKQF